MISYFSCWVWHSTMSGVYQSPNKGQETISQNSTPTRTTSQTDWRPEILLNQKAKNAPTYIYVTHKIATEPHLSSISNETSTKIPLCIKMAGSQLLRACVGTQKVVQCRWPIGRIRESLPVVLLPLYSYLPQSLPKHASTINTAVTSFPLIQPPPRQGPSPPPSGVDLSLTVWSHLSIYSEALTYQVSIYYSVNFLMY